MIRSNNSIFYKVISGFISLSLVLSLAGFHNPDNVYATHGGITTVVADTSLPAILSSIKNTVTAAATYLTSLDIGSLTLKEFVLDVIAFNLAKAILRNIVRSTVQWINSGFQGSPAFITNLGQFLVNIADEIAGEFIYGSELGFLCSPINVRISLALYYQGLRDYGSQAPRCTLSGVVNNVQGFLSGNFLDGGWPGFIALSLEPTNGSFGAIIGAQAELQLRLGDGEKRTLELLKWGRGFLNKTVCDGLDGRQNCRIVTPGDTISEALTFNLSVGQRTLIEADEINEIISALFAQLALQTLQGVGGLLGLSQSGFSASGSGPSGTFTTGSPSVSYLDALGSDLDVDFYTSPTTDVSLGFLNRAIGDETAYQSMHQNIVTQAQLVINNASSIGTACGINDSIIASATSILNTASSNVSGSQGLVIQLEILRSDFQNASTTDIGQLNIVQQFETMRTSGVLHDSILNAQEEFTVNNTLSSLSSLNSSVQACPGEEQGNDPNGFNSGFNEVAG